MLRSIKDVDVKGKFVLLRDDFNVPIDEEGNITDASKIFASLPTIKYLIEKGAKVIIVSHLGRPKDTEPIFKLDNIARKLSELLGKDVKKLDEILGPEVRREVNLMKEGDVILLENIRFDPRETKNDPVFSQQLASLAQIYVNDAFGSAHRAHSSVYGVTEFLPFYAGFLLEKEVSELTKLLENPHKPFILLQGGAKISSKIGVIERLLPKLDSICIGGGMAFTFLFANGFKVGKSMVEEDQADVAREILNMGADLNKRIILPIDIIVTDSLNEPTFIDVCDADKIPSSLIGADIGPATIKLFKEELKNGNSILANGPLGVFENEKFATGTIEIYKLLGEIKERGASIIAAGGDTTAAINKFDLGKSFTYISTGGGATLEFLEGKELPPIKKLYE
jgi:phosphoglycerate kinase